MKSLLNETGAACVSLMLVLLAWHGAAAERKLLWSDEFDGTELDRSKWGYETGFVRNREYQYYTDRKENVRVEGGRLIIEGRREEFPNAEYDAAAPTNEWKRCRKTAAYTSGSINTLGKFGFKYGRIECRAKVPQGAGTWPAVWMMGADFAEVRWPKCGEIDVLEYLGKDPDRVTCNLHGWSPEKAKNPNGYLCGGMSKLDGVTPTDGFHIYAAEWDEQGVTMFYDDRPYGRYSFDAYNTKDGGNCFRKPHFILLNLALGAEWMMPMDKMTRNFPLRFEIDWIRVYDKTDEGWKPLPLYGGGYMQDVVISSSEPNVWYCHADVCGPFRSDDAGRSWRPLHQNFSAAWRNTKVDHVRGVLVDPRNANRVLVAGGDNWNFTGGGIVVSDDGGRTWRMTLKGARFYGNGPRRMYGRVVSRDPFNPDRIVAGEDGDGLWLSRDNGETWKNLGLTNHWFTCVAFDTAKEGRIWATSFAFATKKPEFVRDTGFYRSDDFGETWTRLPCEPPANEFTQLTKGGPILAIFENRFPRFSYDGGQTWQDAFEGLEILSAPPKNPWDRGNFYALGAGKDFYLLGDGAGRIWRRGEHEASWVEHKMTSRAVGDPPCEIWVAERTRHQEAMSQFVIDPRDENHWLTTDWFAIWETKDAGRSFVSRVNGISQVVPFCLAFDPNSAENIAYGLADQGMFISNDGGKSYYPPIERPGTPERRCEIVTYCGNSLAYSTCTPGLLYVTGGKREPLFRVSADAGRTWKAPALRGLPAEMCSGGIAPYAVSVHPVTDDVWITMGGPVGRGKGGIYRSSDRGESWVWAGDGLPEGEWLFKNTEFGQGGGAEIFFSADGSAAVAHARVAGKVFWFDGTDGRWHAATGIPQNSRSKLVADNFTPGRFLIAGSPARESTDGGRTWHPLKGLEKIGMTCGLAADAATPGLFAAVGYDKIYVSRDGAKTFTLLPGAFETVPSSLSRTIYLDRGRLYFLTTGTGVWVRDLFRQ